MLRNSYILPLFLLLALVAARCDQTESSPPTPVAGDVTPRPLATDGPGEVPATWTPAAGATGPAAGSGPTTTPGPAFTPVASPAATTTATTTPAPSPTATLTPTPTAVITVAENLLPNPSFEGDHYNLNGVPELQIPEGWIFEYEEGENELDPDPWNRWVQPEVRVLSRPFLPPHEHDLFIWDGNQTVKVFKGYGALNFRLLADVQLTPGTYLLRAHIFPDLVDEYKPSGTKIWAPDPLSGEVHIIVGEEETEWTLPTFGEKNTFNHVFTVEEEQTVRLGVGIRGPWAITNNGWFLDDWGLYRVEEG